MYLNLIQFLSITKTASNLARFLSVRWIWKDQTKTKTSG